MNIKSKNGSKERLLEMMQGVNKVTINEDYWQQNLNNTLKTAYDKLKSGALRIQQGGANKAVMQTVNDTSYIEIGGYDTEGNWYSFKFKVEATETEQDGVANVDNVELEGFEYVNPDGQKVFDANDDDLTDFNREHGAELYDTIEKYMDMDVSAESGEENDDQSGEEIDEAIDKKEESDPYGGSHQGYQDADGYVDEKPVNPKTRTKSNQIGTYLKEDEEGDGENLIRKNYRRLSSDMEFSKLAKAYENLLKMKRNEFRDKKSTQFAMSSLRNLITDYLQEKKEMNVTEEDVQNFFENWLKKYSSFVSEQGDEEGESETEVPALDVNDVDNDGDKLEGGFGDDGDMMQYDPQEILRGIEVEMEHTKDPKIALEIAMDHLEELPDYYTRLDKMEKRGKEDLNNDIELDDDTPEEFKDHADEIKDADKELENVLLGYGSDTPNTSEEYDYAAQEREYEDKKAYERFQELDSKPFESLSDDEKQEYYELWQNFGD